MANGFLAFTTSMVIVASKLTWHTINPSPLETAYSCLATGYDQVAGSIWMLGGYRYESNQDMWYNKVFEYNNNTSTFIEHNDFSSVSFPTNGVQFNGQIYTQINNSVWFIVDQYFGVFSMDTQSLIYPYKYKNNISP
eukprot:18673_1